MDITLAPKNWRSLIKPKGLEIERDSLTDNYGKFTRSRSREVSARRLETR